MKLYPRREELGLRPRLVLGLGAPIYVCHAAGRESMIFARAFCDQGWSYGQGLVWVKDRMVLGHSDYHYRHEPILYGHKPGPSRVGRGFAGWHGGDDQDSLIEVPRPGASREHPTMKPVELIRRCLVNSTAEGEAVLELPPGPAHGRHDNEREPPARTRRSAAAPNTVGDLSRPRSGRPPPVSPRGKQATNLSDGHTG